MEHKNAVVSEVELTSIVINHLNVGVFLVDEKYFLRSLNDNSVEKVNLFIEPAKGRICDVLSRSVAVDNADDRDGEALHCIECQLMDAIDGALKENRETRDRRLVRQHDAHHPQVRRYYRYSCKPLLIEGQKHALLLIDDITDIERQRAELFEQNQIVHKLNDKFKRDLALAKAVQKGIIPKSPVVQADYHIDFIYFPLEDIGGDMFDIIPIDDCQIGIFMCDVVGHGLPAALITTMVKGLLATNANIFDQPEQLMNKLNRQLIDMVEEPYMTAFYGVINTAEHSFNFVRAGHPFPWKLNDAIQTFGHQSNPIIGIDSAVDYASETIHLAVGDKLILYTDGLLDVGTDDGNYESRLLALFDSNLHYTGRQLLDLLARDLISNGNQRNKRDDVCVLTIERSESVAN